MSGTMLDNPYDLKSGATSGGTHRIPASARRALAVGAATAGLGLLAVGTAGATERADPPAESSEVSAEASEVILYSADDEAADEETVDLQEDLQNDDGPNDAAQSVDEDVQDEPCDDVATHGGTSGQETTDAAAEQAPKPEDQLMTVEFDAEVGSDDLATTLRSDLPVVEYPESTREPANANPTGAYPSLPIIMRIGDLEISVRPVADDEAGDEPVSDVAGSAEAPSVVPVNYLEQIPSEVPQYLQQYTQQYLPEAAQYLHQYAPQQYLPAAAQYTQQYLPEAAQYLHQYAPQQYLPAAAQYTQQYLPEAAQYLHQYAPQQYLPAAARYVQQYLPLPARYVQQYLPLPARYVQQYLPLPARYVQQYLPLPAQQDVRSSPAPTVQEQPAASATDASPALRSRSEADSSEEQGGGGDIVDTVLDVASMIPGVAPFAGIAKGILNLF